MRKFLTLIFLFSIITFSFAGTSGKIQGLVTDDATGEPLGGVNVVIAGETLGAATSMEGYYVILNVSPGTYSLQVSMIGYATVTVNNVKVSSDLTTSINVRMKQETIEGETVVVQAARKLLKHDEFASRHTVSEEEIALQPIDDFRQIARNQAGVVGSHFRGGRTGEVTILVDGMEIKDPAGEYSGSMGGFTGDIPEDAIQEMDVTLGGFGAEYGNVQSGVINLTTRDGGKDYHGSLKFSTTNFSEGINDLLMGERDKWFDTHYQHKLENIYKFSLHGPLPMLTDKITFALSGEITDLNQGYFINQESFSQSYQGKITAKLSDKMKLAVGGLYSSGNWDAFYFPASKYGSGPEYMENEYFVKQQEGSDTLFHYIYVDDPSKDKYVQGVVTPGRTVFEGDTMNATKTFYVGSMQDYLWDRTQNSRNLYAIFTHSLTSRTYYQIKMQSYFTNYHYATKDIEDRDKDGDSDEDLKWNATDDPNVASPIYRERDGNNYWWVRGDDPGYLDQSSNTTTLKADLVSQLTHNHLLKSGMSFSYYNIDVENISWTLGVGTFRKDIWKQGLYDFGAYVQDKIEFEGIIGLVGLRFDYFNPNGFGDKVEYPADYKDPVDSFDENDEAILNKPQTPDPKMQISPRIAISHPISDRDVIRFTYGHYYQRPDAYYLYRNLSFAALTKAGNYVGNPDLKPEKTVAYEVAVEHLFSDNIKGVINAYYKDVTNLMNNQRFVLSQLQNKETRIYFNADYGNMKGLEFSLHKMISNYWGASLNYTFSVAKGRASGSGGGFGEFENSRTMNILDFDQTHTVNANITLISPKSLPYGLNNWMANFQIDYGSGLPYSSYGTGKINDQRLPWTSTTDLRISKNFDLYKEIKLAVILDVFNLFNRENVDYIGSSQYYDLGAADDKTVKGDPSVVGREGTGGKFIRTPQVYSYERQYRLGIDLKF
ncbi:MAG: TonB-dependent receptor [Candidatus Marinimicrobia bacterium]|nr:TonB-dependent receptor [Candidatus Neomarinimicrobiota bacterium]